MHHGHGHGQGEAGRRGRAFAVGAAINLAFVVVQVGFGLAANSMALLADAAHNFADVLALLLAWGAAGWRGGRRARRRTYGWGRSSVLAALVNAMVLLIGVGAIGVEAIRRLLAPEPVAAVTVMAVAAVGIVVNGGAALLFLRDRAQRPEHPRAVPASGGRCAVSAGVVVAALAMRRRPGGCGWIPLASLAIVATIVVGTWGLLRSRSIWRWTRCRGAWRRTRCRICSPALPGVRRGARPAHLGAVHHRCRADRASGLCGADERPAAARAARRAAARRFGIGHATLQIETDADAALCRLRPHDVV